MSRRESASRPSNDPCYLAVDINTNGIPGPEETRWVTIPKTPETYSYDADGNLTADGSWNYTWDGENRLFAMESTSSLPAAAQKTRLEFYYDYLSRRSVKLRYWAAGRSCWFWCLMRVAT